MFREIRTDIGFIQKIFSILKENAIDCIGIE